MHPMYFWKRARHEAHAQGACAHHGCGVAGGGGGGGGRGERFAAPPGDDFGHWGGGGGLGVRRPLRFLAHKLELKDPQVEELARILNELKTERAQAEVDGRRTTAAFADAVGGAVFDEAKAGEGATLRVQSAEKLKNAVQKALREIHAVLSDEQRQRLAYLIRTGVVTL